MVVAPWADLEPGLQTGRELCCCCPHAKLFPVPTKSSFKSTWAPIPGLQAPRAGKRADMLSSGGLQGARCNEELVTVPAGRGSHRSPVNISTRASNKHQQAKRDAGPRMLICVSQEAGTTQWQLHGLSEAAKAARLDP